MGPRALGHRSLLMSPLLKTNKDIMNARVKFREAFRPFAPIVMEEHASEYFVIDKPCRYMLMIPPVRSDKIDIIPAVTHVDGTARVQTVTRNFNGRLLISSRPSRKERESQFYSIQASMSLASLLLKHLRMRLSF